MDAYTEGYRIGRKMGAPQHVVRNARGDVVRKLTAIERTEYSNGYRTGLASVSAVTRAAWLRAVNEY